MDSPSTNRRSALLLVLILAFLSFANSDDNSKEKGECADSLVGLAACLAYVGGTARAPTPDCCSGLKQVLKTNKKCLCVVIKDRNDPDLGININATLALGLPHVCNAPANISQCPALLHLPPDSPDAQIFYQNGQMPTNSSYSSPVSGEPTVYVKPNPTSTPGSSIQMRSGGSVIGKRRQGLEIISGSGVVVLLLAMGF